MAALLFGIGRGPGRGRPVRPDVRSRLQHGAVTAALLLLMTGCDADDPVSRSRGDVSVDDGRTPSLAWEEDGTLWAVFEHEEDIYLSRSDDRGASFATAVRVTPESEPIETGGESRPKVAIGPSGAIYLSWTKKLAGRFTGEVRFTRSLDRGRSFAPPRTVNDDGLAIGHRFDSLLVDPAGHVYVAWIDKRDLEAARTRGEAYRAAALYFAVSVDGGATFSPNRRVADHACECCRIAMAPVPEGGAAVLWRHVFEPSVRDHAFARLGPEGPATAVERISFEDWELEGCPHHGPAMVAAGDGTYHAVWFSAARSEPAIFYGRIDSRGGAVEQLTRAAEAGAAHPDLLAVGDRVLLVWKQVAAAGTTILGRWSRDGGLSWSPPKPLAETTGVSDHPLLSRDDATIYLGWHTVDEGLRVLPVGPVAEGAR